jgi:hypothetical protein
MMRTLLAYPEERGIKLDDLIATALELFFPHPGLEIRANSE